MRAEIKGIYSDCIDDLENYYRTGPFLFHLIVELGPQGEEGADSFNVTVCSPAGLEEYLMSDILVGRHMFFMREFRFDKFKKFIEKTFLIYEEDNWLDLAEKLSRYGAWEFEDYVDYDEEPA